MQIEKLLFSLSSLLIAIVFATIIYLLKIALIFLRIVLWVVGIIFGIVIDVVSGIFLLFCLPVYLSLGIMVVIRYSLNNPKTFFDIGVSGNIPESLKEESRRLKMHAKLITLLILIILLFKYFL